MNKYLSPLLLPICSLLAGLALSGCAGYKLGSVDAGYKTVAVPVFRNQTTKPQLEAPLTNALLRRIQADGSLQVKWADEADVVVNGVILSYDRQVLRSLPAETRTPREYRLRIEVLVEAKHRRTGEVIISPTKFSGQADTFIGSDLQTAENQALPLIADDLARQIVSQLTEKW